VRAVIAEPADGGEVGPGIVRLAGYAWSGSGEVVRVEVSDDGGRTWTEASIGAAASPCAWRRWTLDWRPPRAGEAGVLARATDRAGTLQPLWPDWNRLGYCNNGAVIHRLRASS
jgi:hypothetical protein